MSDSLFHVIIDAHENYSAQQIWTHVFSGEPRVRELLQSG